MDRKLLLQIVKKCNWGNAIGGKNVRKIWCLPICCVLETTINGTVQCIVRQMICCSENECIFFHKKWLMVISHLFKPNIFEIFYNISAHGLSFMNFLALELNPKKWSDYKFVDILYLKQQQSKFRCKRTTLE